MPARVSRWSHALVISYNQTYHRADVTRRMGDRLQKKNRL